MTYDALTHDVLLAGRDGSKRKFRIYGRPMPEDGDMITLPVDGRLVRARVILSAETPEREQPADAEAIELVE